MIVTTKLRSPSFGIFGEDDVDPPGPRKQPLHAQERFDSRDTISFKDSIQRRRKELSRMILAIRRAMGLGSGTTEHEHQFVRVGSDHVTAMIRTTNDPDGQAARERRVAAHCQRIARLMCYFRDEQENE